MNRRDRCSRLHASRLGLLACGVLVALAACRSPISVPPPAAPAHRNRVIVFVWDGLRPDSVNATDTPRLHALRAQGVDFADSHASYPTFTMMNAAAFATGASPGTAGFYGNTVWQPGASGEDSGGRTVDFRQPVFTEDSGILQDLDAFEGGRLLLAGTLFEAARAAGLTTAAIGKSGPAFLQDRGKLGVIVDERMVWPLPLAREIEASGGVLPATTPHAYPAGTPALGVRGNPTAFGARVLLADGVTTDPVASGAPPYASSNAYLMRTYLDHVLPKKPDLTFIWLRSPDSDEHAYGPGAPEYRQALRAQDALLGMLQARLADLGLAATTDLVVASDHGHGSVSGPPSLFPLRAIASGAIGAIDRNGWSVSGDVRLADLLGRAGFAAFDGRGCLYSPVMSGIRRDGTPVYATLQDAADGSACGTPNRRYTTGSFRVPPRLPPHAIVVAANGGSEYLYVPDHDAATVSRAVAFLQSREEIGPIFVASRYGEIAGTLPLAAVRLEDGAGRNPDVVASYAFDETVSVAGFPGITFESMLAGRGMHGSFSPVDVHNTLVASGPDFKRGMRDTLPAGNVDVAPTVAHLLGVRFRAEGRVLLEALARDGADPASYTVSEADVIPARPMTGLIMRLPTSPSGADVDASATSYTVQLHTKTVTGPGRSDTYFEWARALRR